MDKKILAIALCLIIALAALTACGGGDGETTADTSSIAMTLDKTTYAATDSVVITIKNNSSEAVTYNDTLTIVCEETHGDHVHESEAEWKSGVSFSSASKTLAPGAEITQTINLSDLANIESATYKLTKIIGVTKYSVKFTMSAE